MAVLSIISLPALLVSLVVAYVLVRLIEHVRNRQKAARLGCKPAIQGFGSEPSGLRVLLQGLKAQKEKRVPVWMGEEFARLSAQEGRPVGTFTLNGFLFRKVIITSEPKNIQAMLATSFKDFSLGANRINNFKPLLGDGIVSTIDSFVVVGGESLFFYGSHGVV